MPGSEQTIEELVMSSARTYLYGHALAWNLPGETRHVGGFRRPAQPSRLARVRAAGRNAFRRTADRRRGSVHLTR